jgi:class 3 adenylate cyclase
MSTTTRKLAAIMPACVQDGQRPAGRFTDIVGYTALMGSDEDKAFEVLRKNREIHNKFIEHFNGTLIKEMGDGMLANRDRKLLYQSS